MAGKTIGIAERLARNEHLPYIQRVSTVQEITTAIVNLSRDELAKFRSWFEEFDAEAWDEQFADDVAAGRLDRLADNALRDLREGRCTDL